jgi:hypothetical protein
MRSKEGYIENSLGFKVIPDHEAAYAPVREQEPEDIWVILSDEEKDAIWQTIFDHINDLE